jgi:hypothetical protein
MKLFVCSALVGALVLIPRATVSIHAQGGPPRQLPAQASDRADDEVEGDLEVNVEDSNTGARITHHIRRGQERLELKFDTNDDQGFENGMKVRAKGRRQGNTLSLKSGNDVQVLGLAASGTFGEQRTLVILVNFLDNQARPENVSSVFATTFQAVSDFYRENSYGQTWLTGDVVGYYTLPMNVPSTCAYDTIQAQAEQAASANGVNVSAYSRRMIVFPQISACGWWGLGNVGGNPTRAWVNGSYQLFVAAHELGHNFGNHHSRSQPCDAGGCSLIEYGDDHDIMGNVAAVHTNAFQKERLGWLNYGASPPIQTVSTSGTYTIDPMATPGVYPKALKILKSGTTAGSRTYYYVEARTATGFDAGAPSGVLIHTGSESAGNTSIEIDLQPSTSGFDALLDVGQTFTDGAIGLTIRTLAASAGGASVEVSVNGGSPTCVTRAPSVSLSPTGTQTTLPSQQVTYDITVRSNDDSSCAAATFVLGASVPAGWSAAYDRPSVTVVPGTNGLGVLWVTPPATAVGTSTFTATATRTGSSGPSGSTTGTIAVSDPNPPVAMSMTAAAINNRGNVQLTASVVRGLIPVSGASVSFRVVDPKGGSRTVSSTTNSSGTATTSLKLRPKDPSGTYQVQATATSGTSTAAASTSFVD